MISLQVEDYCHDYCREFEPKVIEDETMSGMNIFEDWYEPVKYDYIVKCKHYNRCAAMYRYLKKQETSDGTD